MSFLYYNLFIWPLAESKKSVRINMETIKNIIGGILMLLLPIASGVTCTYFTHKKYKDWKLDVVVFIISTGISGVIWFLIVFGFLSLIGFHG